MLYVRLAARTRNAGKLQEFVNIKISTLSRKNHRFSLELYECYYYYYYRTCQKFLFSLIGFLHLRVGQSIDIDASVFY